MGPPQILICGESGGTSRPFDLAERYRLYDLVAEREVIRSGFEPETHSLEGCCSIQLSYRTARKKRAKLLLFFELCKKNRTFLQ